MASTETIELPLGDLVTPEEWGKTAFVYAPSKDEFYVTQEKHKALEFASKTKFGASVSVKDGQVLVALPTEFARAYMWHREAAITKIVYGEKLAIVVFATPEKAEEKQP